jgi:hypothetical protein
MARPPARIAPVVWAGVLASVVTAIVLAPIMTVGWCNDVAAPGVSTCHSEQRSLLGGYALWWLWLIVQLLIVGAVVVAIRARRRTARESEHF